MPKSFPRAPLPFLSAILSPIAWLYGRPDLFDSYSAGVMLLQLSGCSRNSKNANRLELTHSPSVIQQQVA